MSDNRTIARAPVISLPTFDGSDISKYLGFKDRFQFVVTQIQAPKKLWANYLEECIKGEAAHYIGEKGKWFNKYEALWKTLDDKYGNRWK